MEAAVHAFVAAQDGLGIDVSEAGNYLCEQMVPELPSQLLRQLGGDGSGPATVFALDGDETKHGLF